MYLKVSLFVPFTAPAALTYYSSNITAVGSIIVPTDPISFDVAIREGQYYLNDNPNPNLTLMRGAKYSFAIKNADQRLFPLVFGRSFGTPYIASGAIVVAKGRSTCLLCTSKIHTYLSISLRKFQYEVHRSDNRPFHHQLDLLLPIQPAHDWYIHTYMHIKISYTNCLMIH